MVRTEAFISLGCSGFCSVRPVHDLGICDLCGETVHGADVGIIAFAIGIAATHIFILKMCKIELGRKARN
jgi:hypothetical protein